MRHTDFTAESAQLELDTMYKVYFRDAKGFFRLFRVVALTKETRDHLKAFDRRLLKTKD